MKLYYRISDNSYKKPKLMGATKEVCLKNFLSVFGTDVTVIADKCEESTKEMLHKYFKKIVCTEQGNAGSLIRTIERAIEENDDSELIYFVEDDYLHLPKAKEVLEEGIARADYVTLYDHPDKYTANYNLGEYSKVIKTKSSHWRYTVSTCMTFAAKVKTLIEDKEIWDKYTSETHPHDHHIFTDLGKKGRRLSVAIPGVACHTDLEFSGRIKKILIEPWAIEMMNQELEKKILNLATEQYKQNPTKDAANLLVGKQIYHSKQGWDRLMLLDALREQLEK